ncbi:MAG: hypothetical protein J6J11_02565 [Treponema sp.]|nr:hypothetical protein [Treponema sp.]
MLQFYFLSIVLNVITGFILVYATNFMRLSNEIEPLDSFSENDDSDEELTEKNEFPKITNKLLLDDMTFRLVIAILSGLVGIMKLLSAIQNDVPIIGDLIPAVAGIAGCFALLMEYYSQKSSVQLSIPSIFISVFVGGRKYLGIFCILAGILHFIFPRVLFL